VSRDAELRAAAFAWLAAEVAATGNLLDRDRLRRSVIAGEPMGLLDTGRGIRNPRALDASISVMTSPDGPYDDIDNGSGLIRYAFRTGRADQGDNRKLVRAHELGVPIIYFQKLQANVYTAIYPVRVAGADDTGVLLDVSNSVGAIDELGTIDSAQRRYVTVETRRRLHQVMFRGQVLVAYSRRCAVCRLHEPTLLEASHIWAMRTAVTRPSRTASASAPSITVPTTGTSSGSAPIRRSTSHAGCSRTPTARCSCTVSRRCTVRH
jgi:putative restriction endonuclease